MNDSRDELKKLKRKSSINWISKLTDLLAKIFTNPFFLGVSGSIIISLTSVFLLSFNAWNNYFTPDSEFYLSLLIFGNELVEKVVNPAYYWTKSAQIIPEHILASLFGWESGIQISQFMKLSTIAISSFVIFYLTRKNVLIALIFVSFLTLNGTILTMLGNTYVTATVLSVLTLFYAIMKFFVDTSFSMNLGHFLSIFLAAGILTFSLFIYPILTSNLAIILVTYLVWLVVSQGATVRYCCRISITICVAVGITFSLMLVITKSVFPNQNWLKTVMFYLNNLNVSDYSSDEKYSILFKDFSLLVICVALFISIYVTANKKDFTPSTVYVAISQISLFLSTLFQVHFLDSSALEASFISSFFWIPSLLITCLYFVEKFPHFSLNRFNSFLFFSIILGSFLFFRFWSDDFFRNTFYSSIINSFLVLLVLLSLFLHHKFLFSRTIAYQVFLIFLVYLSFAYFQNSRELSSSALGRIPYYTSSENQETDRAKIHILVEKALLGQLNEKERAVVWTPPGSGLVTYAAMHFWGPNSISLSDELSPNEANYFRALRPEKLFLYVSNREEGAKLLKSLERNGIKYSMSKSIQNFDTQGEVFYVVAYSLTYTMP